MRKVRIRKLLKKLDIFGDNIHGISKKEVGDYDLIYDISTPDPAYQFIQDFFNISGSDFIDEYIIECNSDFDIIWNKREDYINSVNIESLKYKALHVTSNWDDCSEIKTKGIKDLQTVLTEQTTLSNLLLEYGVKIEY